MKTHGKSWKKLFIKLLYNISKIIMIRKVTNMNLEEFKKKMEEDGIDLVSDAEAKVIVGMIDSDKQVEKLIAYSKLCRINPLDIQNACKILEVDGKDIYGLSFKDLQKRVVSNKESKGFNTKDIRLEFCLLYGEVAEAFEAWWKNKADLDMELADIAIYLMGIAELMGIDLELAIRTKMVTNEKRTYKIIPGGGVEKDAP